MLKKIYLLLSIFCFMIICSSGCKENNTSDSSVTDPVINQDPIVDPEPEPEPEPELVLKDGLKLGMQEAYFSLQSGGDGWNFPDLAAAKRMFDYMDDLKIKRFRYTIFWVAAEPNVKGVYEWERHDQLINYLVSKGIKLTVTLFGDNYKYVSDGSSPYPLHSDPAYWTGWLNYVAAAVTRYRDRVSSWEIWNEPDLAYDAAGHGTFWVPYVSVPDYSGMLIATAQKIKSIQPEATLIMGGLTTLPGYRSFLTGCLNNNVLNYIDEIGLHLYRFKPEGYYSLIQDTTVDIDPAAEGVQLPSTFLEDINSLHSLLNSYKTDFPIRNTEEGFYFYTETGERRDLSQLKYITRSVLHQRNIGLEEVTLFRLRVVKRSDYVAGTSGDNQFKNDQNFPGMIDQVDLNTFTPRPVYYALKTMAQYLSDPDSKYVKGYTADADGFKVHVEIYSKNSRPVIAYWIEEDIDNTRKALRSISLTIDGIGDYTYKVADIADNTEVSAGAFQASGSDISFSSLPVTDYPFILYAE